MKKTDTVRAMGYKAIIAEATKKGFVQTLRNNRPVRVTCGACKEHADATFGAGNYPFWAKTQNAIIFTDEFSTVHACPCGHRVWFTKDADKAPSASPVIATPQKELRYCKTEGCDVILPKERKAYCYKCRPLKKVAKSTDDAKEAVSSSIQM